MKFDREKVEHVATLACLSLTDEEAARITDEIAKILGHVAELDALDTKGVPPTTHVQLAETSWRVDEVWPSLDRAEVLAAAPRSEADGFAVPAFVGG
jgi:aspartyl-tRNA(Asn)/glutamyl-tRNA(Gln) amidotransferase subunit C